MSEQRTIKAFFEALNLETLRRIATSDDPVSMGYSKEKLLIQAYPKEVSEHRYKIEIHEYKKHSLLKIPKENKVSEITVSIDNDLRKITNANEKDCIRRAVLCISSEDMFQIYESHEPLTLTLASLDGSLKQVEVIFKKVKESIDFEIYTDS